MIQDPNRIIVIAGYSFFLSHLKWFSEPIKRGIPKILLPLQNLHIMFAYVYICTPLCTRNINLVILWLNMLACGTLMEIPASCCDIDVLLLSHWMVVQLLLMCCLCTVKWSLAHRQFVCFCHSQVERFVFVEVLATSHTTLLNQQTVLRL